MSAGPTEFRGSKMQKIVNMGVVHQLLALLKIIET